MIPLLILSFLLSCATISSIAAEKTLPVLKGKLIFTYPIKSDVNFSYALLNIDGAGVGLSNNLPLHFDIDTTAFDDGEHILSIDIFDNAGLLKKLPASKVIFNNNLIPEQYATKVVAQPASILQKEISTSPDAKATPGMPKIFLDGQQVDEGMDPFFSNNRIMVRLRSLTIKAGCKLIWKGKSGSLYFAQQHYQLTLANKINWLDNSSLTLVHPLIMRKSRVFAPVAIWQQMFNAPLRYDAATKSVYLTSFSHPSLATPVDGSPDSPIQSNKAVNVAMVNNEIPAEATFIDATTDNE